MAAVQTPITVPRQAASRDSQHDGVDFPVSPLTGRSGQKLTALQRSPARQSVILAPAAASLRPAEAVPPREGPAHSRRSLNCARAKICSRTGSRLSARTRGLVLCLWGRTTTAIWSRVFARWHEALSDYGEQRKRAPSRPQDLWSVYSCRSAPAGSTRAARRAGI